MIRGFARVFTTAFVVVALASCDSGGEPGASVASEIARARELVADGAISDALALLKGRLAQVAEQGESEEALALRVELAEAYLANQGAVQAEDHLTTVLRHRSDDARVLLLQGECLRQLARFTEAEAPLRRGLERDPGHLAGTLALARTLYRLGKADESVDLLEAVLRATTKAAALRSLHMDADDRLHLRLEYARALLLAGRLQEGADELARLLIARPFESKLYSELSRAQFRLKNRTAGRFLQELYRMVSTEDFQKNVEEALEHSGMRVFGLSQRAYNQRREKRFLEALRTYEEARAIATRDSRPYTFSARAFARIHRHSDALRVIDEGMRKRLGPVSGLLEERARSLLALERRDEAEAALRACSDTLNREGDLGGVEKGQAGPAVVFLRIGNLLELGRSGEALGLAERAVATTPGEWRAHYWVARAQLELGDPRAALESISRATAAGGEGSDVAIARGRALAAIGELQRASNELMKVVKDDSANIEVYRAFENLASKGVRLADSFFEAKRSLDAIDARIDALEKRIDALPLGRECGLAYLELGKAFIERRDPNAALDILMLGIELAPDHAPGYRLALSLLRRNEDAFLRLRLLHRLVELEPRDSQVNLAILNIHIKLGVLLDDALAAAERYAKQEPGPEAERLLSDVRQKHALSQPSTRKQVSPSAGGGPSAKR